MANPPIDNQMQTRAKFLRKHLTLVFLSLIFYLSSYSQNSETVPTKNETINWIINKLNGRNHNDAAYEQSGKFAVGTSLKLSGRQVIHFNNDETLGFVYSGGEYVFDCINLNDVVNYRVSDDDIYLYTQAGYVLHNFSTDGSGYSFEDSFDIGNINWNIEPNLRNRLIKAISALVEYNNAGKQKEAY